MSATKYPCPKCGKPMRMNGKREGRGKLRWRCETAGVHCYSTTNPTAPVRDAASNDVSTGKAKRFARALGESGQTKRYIVTAAQNATPVHDGFWQALENAAKHLDAELIVIPLRYKNPTSSFTASQANEEIWAEEVEPYLYNLRKKLNPNLVLVGDVKIQPTASAPLTGFEGLTHAESAILGHTKIQLKVVPVPAGKMPKILTTTGACTVPNYTDSRAGKLGQFHHSLGAVLVEVEGKQFWVRQLLADKDGSFTDKTKTYDKTGIYDAPPALGLVMGDVHRRFIDPKVEAATFGPGGIVEELNPTTLVWNDVMDGYAVNPHHYGNPFISFAKQAAGLTSVRKEVEDTISFIDQYTGQRNSVIVASNHDNFLSRWVQHADWKNVGRDNADFYLETALAMLQSTRVDGGGARFCDPFKHWVTRLSTNPGVRCLDVDESFTIAGIEVGMHGDRGPNGSKGTIRNLRRLGSRVVIGHSHTPGIDEGAYQTGTCTPLRLEYTQGPSSWLNAHVVIYASGKRALIFMIDGRWCLDQKTA